MTNITLNLPSTFKIQPTMPFVFTDCETGTLQCLGKYDYHVINDNKRYLIEYVDEVFSDIWLKGFISEEDLINGIVKGRLVIF
jgi:hypothetical protein